MVIGRPGPSGLPAACGAGAGSRLGEGRATVRDLPMGAANARAMTQTGAAATTPSATVFNLTMRLFYGIHCGPIKAVPSHDIC